MKRKIENLFSVTMVLLIFCVMNITAGVYYDTAWTYVYDGGKTNDNQAIADDFHSVRVLPDGACVCVGKTRDTMRIGNILLMKLSDKGTVLWKKLYTRAEGSSIDVAENGDFIIGGNRKYGPVILRTDSVGNVKWSTWYYDSIKDQTILSSSVTVNCIYETNNKRIVCAAGDEFPDNGGSTLNNYAAYLEFDSTGRYKRSRQWNNITGYNITGFDIEETKDGDFLLSGNKSVFYLDTTGLAQWQKDFSFTLEGVGSEVNNITRAKKLRDGTLMVAGQAYEGNCWTKYKKLYYDAWWSPITTGGTYTAWDTAGRQGGDDAIYDFTQLVDGKLVFVGKKSSVTEIGGVWAFVTDSTGGTILWESQINIPYKTADGRAPRPLSVCASPDSGFAVAGDYACTDSIGGMNAFVAHYVPSTAATISSSQIKRQEKFHVNCRVTGSRVVFTLSNVANSQTELLIYDAAGKRVAKIAGNGKKNLKWNCSGMSRGVYLYKIKSSRSVFIGKLILKK